MTEGEGESEVGRSAGEACLSQIGRSLPEKNERERANEMAKSRVMNYIFPRAAGQTLEGELSSTSCTLWANNQPGEEALGPTKGPETEELNSWLSETREDVNEQRDN